MLILSYIMSAGGLLTDISTAVCVDMRKILALQLASNLMMAASYACISRWSGAMTSTVACGLIVINFYYRLKKKEIPIWIIWINIAVFIALNLFAFSRWYDIFAIAAGIMFALGIAQKNGKYYRKYMFVNIVTWITYNILAKATGPLIVQSVLAVVNIMAQRRDGIKEIG